MEIFSNYIPAFMHVFLDDFVVYNWRTDHFEHLRLYLERCRQGRLSLNPTKCIFGVPNKALLGHTVSKDGIVVDPDKVKAILQGPAPTTAKSLSRFLGKIRWHNQMLRYLADFACNGTLTTVSVDKIGGVHHLPSTQSATCRDRLLEMVRILRVW